ncbi:MAG: phosphoenolpyruvate--protein phosphotransferase [Candidatus Cloacimonetes bacterium]|nr:phosphoenolpyruvate--protein phosphotransferase [Candidatus Cloacimonadota bacterium]
MKTLKGVPVSSGITIGKVQIIARPKLKIRRKNIRQEQIETELQKFEKCLQAAINEIDQLISLSENIDNRNILNTHKMILRDPEFHKNINKMVAEDLLSLEMAIKNHFSSIIEIFNNIENEYFSQRSSDFEDVAYRLLSKILDKKNDKFAELQDDVILVTENITPSEVTRVFQKKIKALCTEKGSKNSHSSIIARSMNLPTLVSITGLTDNIKNGDDVIVDANEGVLIIKPDESTMHRFRPLWEYEKQERIKLAQLVDEDCITQDGRTINLMSNIEIPAELDQVLKIRSKGIGLFRTEFLFMGHKGLPDEDEQYEIYLHIAEKLYPHPVVIRTIDVGGDKLSQILNIEHELNPNLGTRGIRISLKHIPVFKTQIRAILRANRKGNIRIMFPMISTVGEIINIKNIVQQSRGELLEEGYEFEPDIAIGAMIEIPSAAITSDSIAEECNFLSIGTNDLVQYTLAVDRDNDTVEQYYIPHHPSVLRLIKMTAENCHQHGIKVAICGEMASEKKYIPLLVGLGIDEFSVSPGRLLMVKNEIRKCKYQDVRKMAEDILHYKTYIDVYTRITAKEC